jgi:hypothetical protein
MSLPQQKYVLDIRSPFTRADARAAGITVREGVDSPMETRVLLLIVTSRGIYNEPHRTLERVRDALREQGVRVPPRFKNEWRRHFPVVA